MARGSFDFVPREDTEWNSAVSKRDRPTCLRAKQPNRSDPENWLQARFRGNEGQGCLGDVDLTDDERRGEFRAAE